MWCHIIAGHYDFRHLGMPLLRFEGNGLEKGISHVETRWENKSPIYMTNNVHRTYLVLNNWVFHSNSKHWIVRRHSSIAQTRGLFLCMDRKHQLKHFSAMYSGNTTHNWKFPIFFLESCLHLQKFAHTGACLCVSKHIYVVICIEHEPFALNADSELQIWPFLTLRFLSCVARVEVSTRCTFMTPPKVA